MSILEFFWLGLQGTPQSTLSLLRLRALIRVSNKRYSQSERSLARRCLCLGIYPSSYCRTMAIQFVAPICARVSLPDCRQMLVLVPWEIPNDHVCRREFSKVLSVLIRICCLSCSCYLLYLIFPWKRKPKASMSCT